MIKKLSEYEQIEGFNKVASAMIMENNLPVSSQEDFEKLFPDQVAPIGTFTEFFNQMDELIGTEEFIKEVLTFDKSKNICILGDYDKRIRKMRK